MEEWTVILGEIREGMVHRCDADESSCLRQWQAHIVLPNSLLRVLKDILDTPPAKARSKTADKAGTTLSFCEP